MTPARRTSPPGVTVREAAVEDLPAVLSVLDAAALETDPDCTRASIDHGGTLVAVRDADRPDGGTDGGTVLGALVLEGEEISAIAVRPRRRGQGIGSALVRTAIERRGRVVAEFHGNVRGFYEGLGFTVETLEEPGRYRGVVESTDG